VSRPVNLGHFVVGTAGLALLRRWLVGPRDDAERRLAELAHFVAQPEQPPLSIELDVPREEVEGGYGRWASTYDSTPNPLIRLEEPVIHSLIDRLPPGKALDAACGTGRHTKYLSAKGHTVIGVDASPAMLDAARAALPEVDFRAGDLVRLPVETASQDLAVCALALTHCPDLGPPVAELARTLRPGGRLLLSDFHPLLSVLGCSAFFVGGDGRAGYVQSYTHAHSAYLSAFRAAGLEVLDCIEPTNGEVEVQLLSGGMMELAREAYLDAFLALPGALIWELRRRG
jgi:SAM-dependent methyltransferase